MGRPRKPEGALVLMATRVPEPIRDRVETIAASEGLSLSAWLARVVTRAVESYPLDDVAVDPYLAALESAEDRLTEPDSSPRSGPSEAS